VLAECASARTGECLLDPLQLGPGGLTDQFVAFWIELASGQEVACDPQPPLSAFPACLPLLDQVRRALVYLTVQPALAEQVRRSRSCLLQPRDQCAEAPEHVPVELGLTPE
jgi:hypothetical protein